MPRTKIRSETKHTPYAMLSGKMRERRVTQYELSKVLGVTIATFSLKLNGAQDFYVHETEKICNYLHCNPSIFYSEKVRSYRNSADII